VPGLVLAEPDEILTLGVLLAEVVFGSSPDEDVDANDTAQELGRAGDGLQLTTTIVNC